MYKHFFSNKFADVQHEVASAHDGQLQVHSLVVQNSASGDAFQLLQDCREQVRSIFFHEQVDGDPNRLIQAQLRLSIHMVRVKDNDEVNREDKWISGNMSVLHRMEDFDDWWYEQTSSCEKFAEVYTILMAAGGLCTA
jgi:hypothetical protein